MPIARELHLSPIHRTRFIRVVHYAPNTCSTRTVARVRLPCCSIAVNGLLRVPLC